jgi:hypothetical protein
MEDKARALAFAPGIDDGRWLRHLTLPLSAPVPGALDGWNPPADLVRLHAIDDSFRLFGTEPWNSFGLLDAEEYGRLRGDEIFEGPDERLETCGIARKCASHPGAILDTADSPEVA